MTFAGTQIDALSFAVLAFTTVQRLAELAIARRNTARLLAQGAVEIAPGHYPLIVGLHTAWLAGLWVLAPAIPISLPLLAVFAALQAARVWVLSTLGGRWTTRIIVLAGAPLVRTGPFRFVSHPNYLIVAGELAVLPLAFGLTGFASIFTVLNALMMAIRIPAETKALHSS